DLKSPTSGKRVRKGNLGQVTLRAAGRTSKAHKRIVVGNPDRIFVREQVRVSRAPLRVVPIYKTGMQEVQQPVGAYQGDGGSPTQRVIDLTQRSVVQSFRPTRLNALGRFDLWCHIREDGIGSRQRRTDNIQP